MQTLALTAGCCALALLSAHTPALAQTVAHWNFDSGTADTPLAAIPATDISGNLNLLYGYDEQVGAAYSSDTVSGSGLSCRASQQDAYTTAENLNNWSPLQWTIEISVKLDQLEGWNTIIGRDGSSQPDAPKSDFYFQNNGENDAFRLDFATMDGGRYVIDSDFIPVAGAWYHVALVGDGSTVKMYVDHRDGKSYRLCGTTSLNTNADANNSLASNGSIWTFGRGWYSGRQVDGIVGNFDDIRFSNGALAPEQFLHAPAFSPTLDVARNGQDVSLAWKLPPGPVRKVEIYRNDKSDPAGRTVIATLASSAVVYIERVPSKDAAYWYWLVVTRANGAVDTVGPVSTRSASVWEP